MQERYATAMISLLVVAAIAANPTQRAHASPDSKGTGGNSKPERGTIERTRKNLGADDARKGSTRDHRRASSEHSDDCGIECDDTEDTDNDDDDDSLAGMLALYVLTVPFWLPAGLAGDWPTPPSGRKFLFRSYPYAGGGQGQFDFLPTNPDGSIGIEDDGKTIRGYPLQVQLRALASFERNSASLDGRRLRGVLRTNWRFGLDGEMTRYTEQLPGGATDNLWHWKALATYSFAVSPWLHMDAAVGARGMRFAAGDHRVGFLFRYAMELTPVRPLHVWALGEIGNVDDSSAAEFEIGVGALLRRFELFVGFRSFRVAGVTFDGPQLGVIVWM